MENKITAVEWLVEQMRLRRDEGLSLSFYDLEMFAKKAKQMEKEQIEKACEFGRAFGYNQAIGYPQPFKTPTTYYNETYKNTNE